MSRAAGHDGMALAARELACVRGERLIFSGIGFSLPAGSVLLLRGGNGSGKSSLLQVLAGLLPKDAGSVLSFGRAAGGAEYLRGLRYVGHGNGVKEHMTAEENLSFYGRFRNWNNLSPRLALERASLLPRADFMAWNLSAGQRRRLALARLLLAPAALWLLDEPCTALDGKARAWFAEMLGEHCAAGGAAVIAQHEELPVTGVPVEELTLS